MTADKLWKRTEREHSRLLGGQGRTGPQGKNLPDIKHEWLACESKERRTPIMELDRAMAQSALNAPEGKLPIVVFHWAGQPYLDDIVCLRLRHFREWFIGEKQEESAKAE